MGAARRAWPRRLCGSVRSLCSASLPPHKVVPMPRLAPTMTTGKVHQWNIGIGDAISPYDLVFQVSITGPELLGNDATEKQADAVVVMEIECIEDGFLAKILAPVGADAGPDQPIAVICEDLDDVAAFANYVPSIKKVPSGQFLWQAYLVSGLEATSCSNS